MRPRAPLALLSMLFVAAALMAAAPSTRAARTAVDSTRVLADIRYLASPALAGRRTGEPGCDTAAAYLAERFRELHLVPLGDDGTYLQHLAVTVGVKEAGDNRLSANVTGQDRTWKPDSDFIPLSFSENGEISNVPLVFVGYGITAEDKHYDDYAGVDVKGKAVIFLRRLPGLGDSSAIFGRVDRSPYADLRFKASNALNHGAVAALIAEGPRGRRNDADVPLPLLVDQGVGGAHIPVISVRREVAAALIGPGMDGVRALLKPEVAMDAVEALQARMDSLGRGVGSTLPGVTVSLKVDLLRDRRRVANVAGMLPGARGVGDSEVVVIGAHYDHLGMGGAGSLEPDKHAIHPGADDNASGTAGVLELARVFGSDPGALKQSIVFLCFTGEEEGLFGSSYFASHSPITIGKVSTMINMDMIGRMRADKVVVSGTGTSPAFPALLASAAASHGIKLSTEASGYGPSDHTSFYTRNRPVLFFFTGAHPDYHKPGDTWEKINAGGEARLLEMVRDVAADLSSRDSAVAFSRVAADTAHSSGGEGYGGGGYGPYLGTVPDFGDNPDIKGVLLSGVREGSPAEKAGIQGGDILVKFGGAAIGNLYDYTYALRAHKPGDIVPIGLIRKGLVVTVTATLGKRK